MIEMICPHCKLGLKFPDEYAGQKGMCDKCGGEMYVVIPPHLRQQDQASMAYQFNVSLDDMQNPNMGVGDQGVSNLMDTGDLDIMSATSGMSARSMGATSYSHSYDHLKPAAGGAGLGNWFKIVGWLGVPAFILCFSPLIIVGAPLVIVVLALCVLDNNKSTGDSKSTVLWLLALLPPLFPFSLGAYMLKRMGMDNTKSIALGVAIGLLSCVAGLGLLSATVLSAKRSVENAGAVELSPPVQIQSDTGTGE